MAAADASATAATTATRADRGAVRVSDAVFTGSVVDTLVTPFVVILWIVMPCFSVLFWLLYLFLVIV